MSIELLRAEADRLTSYWPQGKDIQITIVDNIVDLLSGLLVLFADFRTA